MHENDKDGIRLSKWERFINSKTLWWIIAIGAVLGLVITLIDSL